jgi:hypothetical protein
VSEHPLSPAQLLDTVFLFGDSGPVWGILHAKFAGRDQVAGVRDSRSGAGHIAEAKDWKRDTGSPDLCKVLHIEKMTRKMARHKALIVKYLRNGKMKTNGSQRAQ